MPFDISDLKNGFLVMAKILNSRIGLVILFMVYTASPFGLGSKLDEIRENTALLKQSLTLNIQNAEMIARILDRCHISHRENP